MFTIIGLFFYVCNDDDWTIFWRFSKTRTHPAAPTCTHTHIHPVQRLRHKHKQTNKKKKFLRSEQSLLPCNHREVTLWNCLNCRNVSRSGSTRCSPSVGRSSKWDAGGRRGENARRSLSYLPCGAQARQIFQKIHPHKQPLGRCLLTSADETKHYISLRCSPPNIYLKINKQSQREIWITTFYNSVNTERVSSTWFQCLLWIILTYIGEVWGCVLLQYLVEILLLESSLVGGCIPDTLMFTTNTCSFSRLLTTCCSGI